MNVHHDTGSSVAVGRVSTHVYELDAMRGIAMALVFAFHLNARLMGPLLAPTDPSTTLWWAYVRAGDTGVNLFFVLSGFLLSLPFLKEAAGGPRVKRRQYVLRRCLRILPLYYFAVLVAVALTATQASDLLRIFPHLAFFTYIPGWGVLMPPYSNTWWSLSTEVQYYILLPFLPLALRSRAGRCVGVVALAVYVAVYVTWMLGMWRPHSIVGVIALRLSLLGRAPLFLCGIMLAAVYFRYRSQIQQRLHRSSVMTNGGADGLLLLLLLMLGLLLQWTAQQGPNGAEEVPKFAWHIPEGLLWSSILGVVILAPLRSKAVITNRVFIYLGTISYSMYMWHTAVLHWVMQGWLATGWHWSPGWNVRTSIIAMMVTVLSLLVSQLTYSLIERPFLEQKSRIV